MNCKEARPLLPLYLGGEAREIEPHLNSCDACRKELDELREAERLIAQVAPRLSESPAHGFAERALARCEHRRGLWRGLRIGGGLAAALVLAFVSYVVYVNTYEPPAMNLSVLGSKQLVPGSTAVLHVRCTDRQGEKLSSAVRVLWQGKEIGRGTSDRNGLVPLSLTVPDAPDGEYSLQLVTETDVGSDRSSIPVTLRRPARLMITTDKPLYQPLQTVHIRLLAVDTFTLKPIASKAAVTISNPNGTKILQKELTASDYGIASTELPLPDELIFGRYRIEASIGETTSERTFEVKRYVLPKFKVDVKLDRTYYDPSQTMRGTVTARYFFGKPVENAVVGIGDLEGQTGPQGTWTFELPAQERVEATVVDTAGHVETGTATAVVSRDTLKIHAIPYGGKFLEGRSNDVYLVCTRPDGSPARVSLKVNGSSVAADEFGVARFRTSDYLLSVEAERGRRDIDLRRYLTGHDVVLHTERLRVKAGGTATFVVLSTQAEGTVYLDVVKERQTLLTRAVELENGRAQVALDLPPELAGTVDVRAYQLGSDRAAADRRVLCVERPNDLTIEATPSKDTFRPGESMKVDVRVVDGRGRPVQAALGVSVVDAAALAVAEHYPGMELAYFSIDESLTRPRWSFEAGLLTGSPWRLNDAALPARASNIEPFAPQPLFTRFVDDRIAEARARAESVNGMALNILIGLGIMVGIGAACLALLGAYQMLKANPAAFLCAALICALLGYASVILALCSFVLYLFVMELMILASPRKQASPAGVFVGVVAFGVIALVVFSTGSVDRVYKSAPLTAREQRALPPPAKSPRIPAPSEVPEPVSTPTSVTPRVREYFPETLYWNPQAITDEGGRATIDVPAADSITTWKFLCSAISKSGAMGGVEKELVVFQDFFADLDLPVTLTQGDRIRVPVLLYNYLDEAQSIRVTLDGDDWFEAPKAVETVELKSREIRSVEFTITARRHGWKKLSATAIGSRSSDALSRSIEILPDGRPIEVVHSDRFRGSARFTLDLPKEAFAAGAWVRVFPSTFSEIVTGLDRLVRLPYG